MAAPLSRRSVTAGLLGSALLPMAAGGTEELASLALLGAEKGIEVGAAFNGNANSRYRQLIAWHCGVITPENAMKPLYLAGDGPAAFAFEPLDLIADWCRQNGLKLHGHTLFWHQAQAAWLDGGTFSDLSAAYRSYAARLLPRYADILASLDVVNEVMSEHSSRYREQPLLDRFGDRFVADLFRIARDAAPGVRLLVNDYNLECSGDWCGRKRDNMLAFLDRMIAAGAPIDAVGIQGHLSIRYPPSPKALVDFIGRLGDLGLDAYLTELDVNDIDMPADIETRDRDVAALYRDVLGPVLERPNVRRIAFWGLTDADHWLVRGNFSPVRTDLPPRPALFDVALAPKPSYYAVAEALLGAPARN